MSKLSFLDGDTPAETENASPEAAVEAAPTPEAPAPEASEAPAGQLRAPDGKFAPKAAAETPAPETLVQPPVAPPAPPAPEPGHVPIAAMLDEREKRQALERQLKDFQDREAKAKADREAVAPLPAPDFSEDPTGHLDAREADLQARIYTMNREFSRRLAVKEYGKETVETVQQWATGRCDADPQFNQAVFASEDPYEFVVQSWKREQVLAKFSADDLAQYDEFQAWKTAQAAGQTPQSLIAAAPAAPSQPAPKPPPPGLVSAPSAAGPSHVPQGAGQAYADTFGNRT